jgi:hypothetical protein
MQAQEYILRMIGRLSRRVVAQLLWYYLNWRYASSVLEREWMV